MSDLPFYRTAEVYLFDTCTLKCGFCHLAETGKVLKAADLEPYRDPTYIDRVTQFFNKRTSEDQKWHLMLTGGEPLLMPNFPRFCENLFDQGNCVSLYTSLMIDRNHKSFQFLLGEGARGIEYIMASYHPEAEQRDSEYWQRIKLLSEANHHIFLRFVGHPKRLESLDRLSERCRELDICFYPTTLLSETYPESYTEKEKLLLASHFSSLSQVIQLAGGIDTRYSKCFGGSRIIAVHLPTGDIWPCISVHTPVLGNVYEDRLNFLAGPISCPEAGIACVCDVHFQQNVVLGTEDNEIFNKQKSAYVSPMPVTEQTRLVKERNLHFTTTSKGIGHVSDHDALVYSKAYVKEQFKKNFGSRSFSPAEPHADNASGTTMSTSISPEAPENPSRKVDIVGLDESANQREHSTPQSRIEQLSSGSRSLSSYVELRSRNDSGRITQPEQRDTSASKQIIEEQQSEIARLRTELEEWEALWASVENSAGWRVLTGWRRVRDILAPEGSRRRWVYNSVISGFRS